MKDYFMPTKMAIVKKENNNIGADVEKQKPLYIAGGNVK